MCVFPLSRGKMYMVSFGQAGDGTGKSSSELVTAQ